MSIKLRSLYAAGTWTHVLTLVQQALCQLIIFLLLLFSINSCFLRSFIIGGSSMSWTDNSDNLSSLWIFIPLLIRPFALVKTWKKTSTFYYRILQNNYITLCKPSNITTNPSNVLPLSMILLLATHSGCRVLLSLLTDQGRIFILKESEMGSFHHWDSLVFSIHLSLI